MPLKNKLINTNLLQKLFIPPRWLSKMVIILRQLLTLRNVPRSNHIVTIHAFQSDNVRVVFRVICAVSRYPKEHFFVFNAVFIFPSLFNVFIFYQFQFHRRTIILDIIQTGFSQFRKIVFTFRDYQVCVFATFSQNSSSRNRFLYESAYAEI